MVLQMPSMFPGTGMQNRAIMIKGNWRGDGHFVVMIDSVVCLQPDGGAQCFPLYLYENANEAADGGLFSKDEPSSAETHTRRDGITDAGLAHFQQAYPAKAQGNRLTKEDLFYYIYGLLHSPDYRNRFADNLGKEQHSGDGGGRGGWFAHSLQRVSGGVPLYGDVPAGFAAGPLYSSPSSPRQTG